MSKRNIPDLDRRARLRRFAENPFGHRQEHRIRTRAYYHWQNRTSAQWWDATENWLLAEDEEIAEISQVLMQPRFVEEQQQALNDLAFHRHYRRVAYHIFPRGMRKTYIDRDAPRGCAICLRKLPEVTFRKDAHVVPELLGNRGLLTMQECDECNDRFGENEETELGKWLAVDRVVARVPTKKRAAPKYKRRKDLDDPSTMVRDETKLILSVSAEDDSIRTSLTDPTTLTLSVRGFPFKGISAVRAVAKSVFLCLPEDLRRQQEHVRKWLVREVTVPSVRIVHVFMPGAFFNTPGIGVWQLDREASVELADVIAMLWFGNTVLFWGSPSSATYEPIPMLVPDLPAFRGPGAMPNPLTFTYSDDEPVTSNHSLDMKHASRFLRSIDGPVPVQVAFGAVDAPVTINAQLETPQIDEETVLYRIFGREILGEFAVTYRPGEGFGEVTYKEPTAESADPAAFLRCLRFVRDVAIGKGFRVVDPTKPDGDQGREFFVWPAGEALRDASQLAGPIELCENIVTINEQLGKQLRYPTSPTPEDAWSGRVLAVGLTDGIVCYTPPNGRWDFGVTRRDLESLRQQLASKTYFDSGVRDLFFEIGGQRIEAPVNAVRVYPAPWALSDEALEAVISTWGSDEVHYVTIDVEKMAVQFKVGER